MLGPSATALVSGSLGTRCGYGHRAADWSCRISAVFIIRQRGGCHMLTDGVAVGPPDVCQGFSPGRCRCRILPSPSCSAAPSFADVHSPSALPVLCMLGVVPLVCPSTKLLVEVAWPALMVDGLELPGVSGACPQGADRPPASRGCQQFGPRRRPRHFAPSSRPPGLWSRLSLPPRHRTDKVSSPQSPARTCPVTFLVRQCVRW